jgi:dihydrofolate reductase
MITIIAAVSKNGIIGNSKLDALPWHCSEELQFFKKSTMGKTLVMGRKTFEQVGKLPGRNCIVVSNDRFLKYEGCVVATFNETMDIIDESPTIEYAICGGAEIYKLFAPHADASIISYLDFEAEGDVPLPDLIGDYDWKVEQTQHNQFISILRKR